MKRLLASCLALAACAAPAPAPEPPPAKPLDVADAGKPERGELVDEAVLIMTLAGKKMARERYSIYRSESGYALATEQQFSSPSPVELAGVLMTDTQFRPEKGQWEGRIAGQPFSIALSREDGKLVKVTRAGGDERREVETREVQLFVADNTAAHISVLCSIAPGAGEVIAFPGVVVKYSEPRPLGDGLVAREVDFGGRLGFTLACEGPRLRGLYAPFADFLAVREDDTTAAELLVRKPREKPPLPATLIELPRKVQDGTVELDCSLVVPAAYADEKRRRRLPAVVFISGSGPQDRDEDSIGPGGLKMAIFKTLAIAFGEAGIASLRCDDLGTGASSGDFASGTRQAFTALVAAEVAALRADPMIDPARIGLVGHSEGGYLAPLAAAADPKIKALLLMAAPARPLDAILYAQVESGLRGSGVDDTTLARELDKVKRVFASWRSGVKLPSDLPDAERAAWEQQAAWFKSYLDHDPLAVAAGLGKVAVFVAQGEKDQQVPASEAEKLGAAFGQAGNKKLTVKVYPGLNHLFFAGKTGTFSDYADPDAVVDAGFVSEAVAFLKKNL